MKPGRDGLGVSADPSSQNRKEARVASKRSVKKKGEVKKKIQVRKGERVRGGKRASHFQSAVFSGGLPFSKKLQLGEFAKKP